MNDARQAINNMLDTLECRLNDVKTSFSIYKGPLEGLEKKLDFIDDKLYELDCYFDSQALAVSDLKQESDSQSSPLAGAKQDMVDIAKDGAQVFGDLTRSLREIKDAFKGETRES